MTSAAGGIDWTWRLEDNKSTNIARNACIPCRHVRCAAELELFPSVKAFLLYLSWQVKRQDEAIIVIEKGPWDVDDPRSSIERDTSEQGKRHLSIVV